jgi:acyl-CoA synthetase (AMP-forming)/AMP-acid ligase II
MMPSIVATSLVQLVRERARADPDNVAFTFLTDGESSAETLTYGELDARACAIAAVLLQHDARGQRALLLYAPSLDYILAFFGCLYAGVIAVPA